MKKRKGKEAREQVAKWTCNQFAITNHQDDTAELLRKVADNIDELEPIDILAITYSRDWGPKAPEVTAHVYFALLEDKENSDSNVGSIRRRHSQSRRRLTSSPPKSR
jgi:hypothetical protein